MYQWLSSTTSKGVCHATISTAIWFLLLLRPDVDSPPKRVVDLDVVIVDVGNLTT
jgi:hypothetical protein